MSSVQILLRNTAHNSIVCFMINPKVSWSEDLQKCIMYPYHTTKKIFVTYPHLIVPQGALIVTMRCYASSSR